MLYPKLYFSLVYYLCWMAGVARLALGIHPLWHFSDWTGVVCCGWFVDTLAYYYFNWIELYWEHAVLYFYRHPAAGITKWVHLNISVTLNLSFTDQFTFQPLCLHIMIADATVKFAGDQVALVGLFDWDAVNSVAIQYILQLHLIIKPRYPLPFCICVMCHYANIGRRCGSLSATKMFISLVDFVGEK